MLIKLTLQTQVRALKKLEHKLIGIKCNVTLTKSEEELFSRSDETNSTVCCTLIREFSHQVQHLNRILNFWTDFDNMLEEFLSNELYIQNKLSDLDSIVCCMTRKTKDFEESEVAEENCVHQERKQFLQRSEERQTILKDLVNSYSKSEDRDHSIRDKRRMREKTLDKERLMDRAALKLALKRMMRIMGAPEIQKTSSLTKREKSPSQIGVTKV
ncbi:uncharacterized protein LOC122511366 [Leptopilina heterotoma]|uniref:uncharacterized protein LOC122511366 n=1 Tax=Leptopilina heterotoma TaxID=63436 RepID=UPI001CA8831C|nr:uncharacterized protein LOC122511366 [Leptopilina heterotoma]